MGEEDYLIAIIRNVSIRSFLTSKQNLKLKSRRFCNLPLLASNQARSKEPGRVITVDVFLLNLVIFRKHKPQLI